MFSVGIAGLPNVGKSTLFKALTKKQVDISNYPFCTVQPNIGTVSVPDKRLEKLAEVFKPPKVTPTIIEFVDIAGLVKGAHKGEGLGNQFLGHIRQVDVICQVVRDFESEKVSHVEGSVNPGRDIETVNSEIIAKDLETIERRLEKTKKEAKSGDKKAVLELEGLEKIKNWLVLGKLTKEMPEFLQFKDLISELFLLTAKPIIYVYNEGSPLSSLKAEETNDKNIISLDLKIEAEIADLSQKEIEELQLSGSRLDQLIRICYDILELITFYTIAGGKELRAWTLTKGSNAFEAAGKVHSDFQEKFIKAEVIDWQTIIAASSQKDEANLAPSERTAWHKARELGKIRTVGKDYLVQNGEIIEFKI